MDQVPVVGGGLGEGLLVRDELAVEVRHADAAGLGVRAGQPAEVGRVERDDRRAAVAWRRPALPGG